MVQEAPEAPGDPDAAPELLVWERPVVDTRPRYRFPEGQRAYRRHQRLVGAVLLPLMALLVPAMQLVFVVAVWIATRSGDLARGLGAVLGLLGALAIMAYAINWIGLLGNRRFARTLGALLSERLGREGGELVSIATQDTTSFFERHMVGHADVGMLYLDDEALVFEGLRQRMVVPRTDLRDVTLTFNWQFAQFGGRWCVVRHVLRDGARERPAELRINSRHEATIVRNVAATRSLHERIANWWARR